MKKIVATLGFVFVLLSMLGIFPSVAQIPQFPQTLPPNTVVGRTGISAGPAQAIPLSQLQGVISSGLTCPSTLNTFQFFANVTNAPTATTLNIFDGAQCVEWASLNQTAHTIGLVGSSSGFQQALTLTQTPSGSASSTQNYNQINITDSATISSVFFGNGFEINHSFGGPSVQGGRQAFIANAFLTSTSSPSSGNRNYVGVVGIGQSNVNDNGTNPAAFATSAGAVFGGNFEGVLGATGATAFLNVSASEFNSRIVTGASSFSKSIIQLSSDSLDRTQGSVVDTMIWMYNQSSSNPGWNTGILIDNTGGITNGVWPIVPTGTIFKTGGNGTAALGIDFSNTTFSTGAFKSAGFLVNGSGNVSLTGSGPQLTAGANGGNAGSVQLNGSTSGSVTVTTTATGGQLDVNDPIVVGSNGGTGGALTLEGATSGSVALTTPTTGNQLSVSNPIVVGANGGAAGSITLEGSTSGSSSIQVGGVGAISVTAVNGEFTINTGGGNAGILQLQGLTSGSALLSTSATGGHATWSGSGTVPTANACTGFALTTGSSDIAGRVSFTSAAACSITFGTAFTNVPFCVASSPGDVTTVTPSTSGLAVAMAAATTSMQWICYGI